MSYKALDLLRPSSCLVVGTMKTFLGKWYSETMFRSDNIVHVTVAVVVAVVSAQGDEDPVGALEEAIPGSPGEDYPTFATPPDTSFLCDGFIQGYYADPEAECQSFHICADLGTGDLTKYSFLCPNGTLFNQQYFICDWWFNVDCSQVKKR
jgi:hypothetical protein